MWAQHMRLARRERSAGARHRIVHNTLSLPACPAGCRRAPPPTPQNPAPVSSTALFSKISGLAIDPDHSAGSTLHPAGSPAGGRPACPRPLLPLRHSCTHVQQPRRTSGPAAAAALPTPSPSVPPPPAAGSMGANCCKPEPDEPEVLGAAVKAWKRPKWKSDEPLTEEQLQVGRASAARRAPAPAPEGPPAAAREHGSHAICIFGPTLIMLCTVAARCPSAHAGGVLGHVALLWRRPR